MIERIDAHHHLWRYAKEEYGWIGENMGVLARDFLPEDLERELAETGVDGTVAVQARQTTEETEWLLGLAEASPSIQGVVGWAAIASGEFAGVVERLSRSKKLKGLRHVVQDEPDQEFLLRPEFNAGIALLKHHGLVYDILIYERQLTAAIAFVDRHPRQKFVLDHMAKPRIRHHQLEPWQTNIRELARRENVYCKISGLVTEADWSNWSRADLRPYLDVVLDAFGPSRLMAGSDWPVCLLATTPQNWFCFVREFVRSLSSPEREAILGGVATEVYSLKAGV
ncbi:MAG TPA: amidohydrolase family protein [Candidatus Acidoferrum sp.]